MLSIVLDNILTTDIITITDKNTLNHLKVMRVKKNDEIRAVDGKYEYILKVIEIGNKLAKLELISKGDDIYTLNVNIDVAIAVIKQDKFNIALQKLTEIGINRIIPLKTEYSVINLESKKEKWDIIVKEAMKQCKAVKPTKIENIQTIYDIEYKKYDKILFIYEKAKKQKISEYISEKDKNILYLIGPEGGWDLKEVDYLKDKSILINLGNRILRAETAAIYVASVLANNY